MHQLSKLVLDTFCEVYPLLKSHAYAEFWDFGTHDIIPGAVYLLGRRQFVDNKPKVRSVIESGLVTVVLSNPHEGAETLRNHVLHYGMEDLIADHRLLLIGGGDMSDEWPCLQFDSFLPKLLDYTENVQAVGRSDEIYNNSPKPYQFLFLNGRGRNHRRYLIEKMSGDRLLDRALWSNLDRLNGPVKLLPKHYEIDRYRQSLKLTTATDGYVKFDLFNNEWGEIYLNPEAYVDTYFSLVSETVFEWPYSFRTEKIWKPIVMGQPWLVAANRGFLRDMWNLGFRTFGHLIDETYDKIDDNYQRLDRIIEVVADLCQQDLGSFLAATQETCKYNQQHYAEMRVRVREEFPQRFFQFIKKYARS